ncbi:MAG: Ni/Fe hydrogenase subunit alpha [Planctomycetes bacterium]|nr:Ni/Fe hydrogenase subunit alpha [Planctomycetota bacterium]
MANRTIEVDYLARVEGEGALFVKIENDVLRDVKLRIFEPPRFFEAFLRGRKFTEAPDITARICGICPIAYLHGAAQAMEDACRVTIPRHIRELRRLVYCGEWIESHVLHAYMLHLPDFLGYPDAITMAKDHPEAVQRALRMKKIGNDLMVLFGGREIHPINIKVGGFYSLPSKAEVRARIDDLRWGLDASLETVRFVAGLEFPDFEQDYEFVALRHPNEYPFNEGRLVSSKGIDVPISQYDDVLVEEHVAHSTSLHTRVVGRDTCHVGPLARYSLNFGHLSPLAKEAARDAGLGETCSNPFRSIVVRAVETVFAFEEALRIVDHYEDGMPPSIEVAPRAGTGYGCTEAPRGICYHRYTIDDRGTIQDAKIVSPTAVNQPQIEKDLWDYVEPNVQRGDDELRAVCELAIRNYDPCISCSCHFLDLTVERS